MKKLKKKIKPTSLILYLTKRCDSRCPYCTWILKDPDFFHTRVEYDMLLETAKKIVDYYYDIGVRKVRLQAEGEVLIYAHLEALLVYCKNKGYRNFDFPTNAIQLDKHIDFVLKYLSSISISIDGHDAKTFIEHRGGTVATFNKVINNTKSLADRKRKTNSGVHIQVNCVIHDGDYKKFLPMVDLAEDLGVDAIRFSNFHALEGGKGLQAVTYKHLRYIEKLASIRDNKVEIKLPKIDNRKNFELAKKGVHKFSCGMLFNTAVVGSDLDYAPCCRIDSGPQWGNFDSPDKHNSSALQNLRKSIIKAKIITDLHKDCQSCTRLRVK